MKRENILIAEDFAKKRVAAVKFIAPGDIPALNCLIHFGEESDRVEMQNCIIKNNVITKCSPDDAYDFETGALIALMKMSGLEKSAKAYAEIFDDTAYGDALIERDKDKKEIVRLSTKINQLFESIGKKNRFLKEKDEEIEKLKKAANDLHDFNERLINEIDQKNHEIISLKALKISNEALKKDCVKYAKENMELKHSNETLKKDNELFRKTCEKLKTDCEKLQHGYNDTDTVKHELPRTLDINGTVYRKSIQIKDFGEQINKLTVDSLIEHSRAFTRKCVDE